MISFCRCMEQKHMLMKYRITMEMYMNQDDLQHMYRINLQIEFYSRTKQLILYDIF